MNSWHIKIGMNTMVNSNVTLDGRGDGEIGDNCSISYGAVIYSVSHHIHTDDFEYYKKRTTIGSGVWIGTYAVVNAGTVIKDNCVLGANSVANVSIDFEPNGVYVGVPVKKVFMRRGIMGVLKHRDYFR